MIDPIVLGYALLAMLGVFALQVLFVIWISYNNWKWRKGREVRTT